MRYGIKSCSCGKHHHSGLKNGVINLNHHFCKCHVICKKHGHCKHNDHKMSCCHKNFECEGLTGSIAETESALARILDAQAYTLKNSAGHWSPEQVTAFTKHMEKTLRNVILKEIVMLLMLEENLCCEKKCEKDDHHYRCKDPKD